MDWILVGLRGDHARRAPSVPGTTSALTYVWPMAVNRTRRARAAKKRKRRMERVEHDLSVEQWTALQDSWGGCAYCAVTDAPMQRDCVLALSRGGRYTLANVVPACGSCNASKCNDEVTGWLRRKRLDERTFLLRHREISTELGQRFDRGPVEEPAGDGTVSG
jgi:5-methylcytosine-specific restriction endonuclease McrA